MPTNQLSLNLIHREANGSVIDQRSHDGYVNASQLCQVAKKKWHQYVTFEPTGKFLRKLSDKSGIAVSDLNQQVTDETGLTSVWVHPKVAVHLAQWLSEDFAVQVSDWVFEWMGGKTNAKPASAIPYHMRRHMENLYKIPPSHFSILQEMSLTLIGPLEAHGYTLPDHMVPDISQGRMFCDFLRKKGLVDPASLPTYKHSFPDGRIVDAKLYPVELLAAFRTFLANTWMPQRAAGYFKERAPAALPFLDKVLRLEAPTAQNHSSFVRLA
jgi:hypothetical protein